MYVQPPVTVVSVIEFLTTLFNTSYLKLRSQLRGNPNHNTSFKLCSFFSSSKGLHLTLYNIIEIGDI